MIRVLFVCLGNICRSPMAEGVFLHVLKERGLEDQFEVDSAGTGSWHVGEPPDPRALAVLREKGVRLETRARQVTPADADRFDHILTMDESNLENVLRILPDRAHERVRPVLSIAGGGVVQDPYFGGAQGFVAVYEQLHPVLERWVDHLLEAHGA